MLFRSIPKAALWLFDYLEELSAFPTGQYDDQVDSTTQFLNWITARDEERVVVYDSMSELGMEIDL